jgi:hypothetical protein
MQVSRLQKLTGVKADSLTAGAEGSVAAGQAAPAICDPTQIAATMKNRAMCLDIVVPPPLSRTDAQRAV